LTVDVDVDDDDEEEEEEDGDDLSKNNDYFLGSWVML
jgi:hypothetical protein